MTQDEMNSCGNCGHQCSDHATHGPHHLGGMKYCECAVHGCMCKEYIAPTDGIKYLPPDAR